MFDRVDHLSPEGAVIDQLYGRELPSRLSVPEVTCLVEQLLATAATQPENACPVRGSLIQVIADFDAGWDDYRAMTGWLMRATKDIEHSAGSSRLTQRRAYRCAEEAFLLAIDLLSTGSGGRAPLDVTALKECRRIDNQNSALKAHKALKRMQRMQRVAGWHTFVVDAALSAIGSARMSTLAGTAASRLGQIVQLVDAVAGQDATALHLRRRMVDLEREIALMVEDAEDLAIPAQAAA